MSLWSTIAETLRGELDPRVAAAILAAPLLYTPFNEDARPLEEVRESVRRNAGLLRFVAPAVREVRNVELAALGDSTSELGTIDPPLPHWEAAPTLAARLYRPFASAEKSESESETEPLPLIVFYHGGGWVIGDLETHDVMVRELCHASGALVLSVAYRLAPEHAFPAAVADACAAFGRARRLAPIWGADPNRMAVCGDSAGGNLATVVSDWARHHASPAPRAQGLLYPALNLAEQNTESYQRYATGHILDRSVVDWFLECYAPQVDLRAHPFASPLLRSSQAGMPPACIVTAGCDVLRDEGLAYGAALREAGNTLEYHEVKGVIHGFASYLGLLPQAREALQLVARFLAEHLDTAAAEHAET